MGSVTGRADDGSSVRQPRTGPARRHLEVVRERPAVRGDAPRRVHGPLAGLAAPGPGQAPLRLTRRGRLVVRVVVAILLALVVASAVLLLGRPAEAGTEVHPAQVRRHVVQPGETLWSVAGRVAPSVDRRDTVLRIIRLNGLTSSDVGAGQELAVPPA